MGRTQADSMVVQIFRVTRSLLCRLSMPEASRAATVSVSASSVAYPHDDSACSLLDYTLVVQGFYHGSAPANPPQLMQGNMRGSSLRPQGLPISWCLQFNGNPLKIPHEAQALAPIQLVGQAARLEGLRRRARRPTCSSHRFSNPEDLGCRVQCVRFRV